MRVETKLWILRHPRLLYLAVIAAILGGYSLGCVFAGSWGGLVCQSICLWLAIYGYAHFRTSLLRTSGGSPPPEPPTEGSPRPAPLVPMPPFVLSAHADLPNDADT
ncbi:MAG: hypothetical protein ABL962_05605 [Fimbriimonadaceae bacterium]